MSWLKAQIHIRDLNERLVEGQSDVASHPTADVLVEGRCSRAHALAPAVVVQIYSAKQAFHVRHTHAEMGRRRPSRLRPTRRRPF